MQIFGTLLPEKERLAQFAGQVKSGKAGALYYLALIGLLAGMLGTASIFVLGHGHTINTTSQVPWGLQISTYVYFALVSGGCIFTNFIGSKFYHDSYQPLASRVIFMGLVTAIAGFMSLAAELGHVERMYQFMLSPNPSSPMFWMSVWYTADITILIIEYFNIQHNRHSQALLYASFIIPVITYCSLGSLFGAVSTIPYFYSALMPVLFLCSGFLAGNALCAIIAVLKARQSGNHAMVAPFVAMQKGALAAVFVVTACRILIGVANTQSGYEIFRETLPQNILLGLGAGIVVPFALLIYNRTLNGVILSSVIVLVTQFLSRLDLVVSGFRIPQFRVYDMPERLSYLPSIFEILVVVASISIVTVVYLAGEKTGLFDIAGKGEH